MRGPWFIIGRDGATFTAGTEVLSRVEAEAAALPMEPAFFQDWTFLKKYSAPCAWQASSSPPDCISRQAP